MLLLHNKAVLYIMILVADSGSTKCDWQVIANGSVQTSFSTKGFNPFFWKAPAITHELLPVFEAQGIKNNVEDIFFYGAGCSNPNRNKVLIEGLSPIFPKASINIHHDLLAAARATCGNQAGMVSIMGTGSNTCLYDGKNVIDNVSNLGYLIGDEGSGSHLGKALIRAYAYREMPPDLISKFEEKYKIEDVPHLVSQIYGADAKNVFLAGFSKFYSENPNHPFLQELIQNSFQEFVKRHLLKYNNFQNLKAHFVGSVAYYFKDILTFVLAQHNIKLGTVIKKPINNLVQYHLKKDTSFSSLN